MTKKISNICVYIYIFHSTQSIFRRSWKVSRLARTAQLSKERRHEAAANVQRQVWPVGLSPVGGSSAEALKRQPPTPTVPVRNSNLAQPPAKWKPGTVEGRLWAGTD